ncbi:hypothetical protein V6N11_057751 [Hibiscus sabdariffa]|uniref:Formin-like protein n=1 Tax=Hibiscus sabdariffa TaxID=183260 RepID=A0ABR2NIV3_9ROSI
MDGNSVRKKTEPQEEQIQHSTSSSAPSLSLSDTQLLMQHSVPALSLTDTQLLMQHSVPSLSLSDTQLLMQHSVPCLSLSDTQLLMQHSVPYLSLPSPPSHGTQSTSEAALPPRSGASYSYAVENSASTPSALPPYSYAIDNNSASTPAALPPRSVASSATENSVPPRTFSPTAKNKPGKSNSNAAGRKPDKVQLSAILALDDAALDPDQIENLIKFCPTKEEIELLKVRNSVKLKRIMQTILSLGNALNQGTARDRFVNGKQGSAVGFRLDSLLKLTDTRSRNTKMTLMHYLCKVLKQKMPELLDFPKDLTSLEAATKVQLKVLADETQAISKGLEKVVQELSASEKDGPVSGTFCKTVREFLSFAEGEVKSLTSLHSYVGKNADGLAHYFGEDPAKCPFEQDLSLSLLSATFSIVMSTLLSFSRTFLRAHEENCKQLELEMKKAKEAENEKLKK